MTVMMMCSDFVLSYVMVNDSSLAGVVGAGTGCRLEQKEDVQCASNEDGLESNELSADGAVAIVVDTHRVHVRARCLNVLYHLKNEKKNEIEAIVTS